MSIQGLAQTMIGIVLMSALAGCLQPVVDEPVATATASISPGDDEATSASWQVETNSTSYLCRYLCPEVPKIFNGISNYEAQACLFAETACWASGCTSCEFYEIIARCPECS